MAIVKMVAVTIAGKIEKFDRVVEKYVYNRDIHLENAISVLGNKKRLSAFDDSVRYDSLVKNAENIIKIAGFKDDKSEIFRDSMTYEEMSGFLDGLNAKINEQNGRREELLSELASNKKGIKSLENMKDITGDISRLGNMEFVYCRFGKIPKGGYKMLNTYLADMDIIFLKTSEDENNVWGFYFAPQEDVHRIDDLFTSMYFERIIFPRGITGSPAEISQKLSKRNDEIQKELDSLSVDVGYEKELFEVYRTAKKRQKFADVRSNAAHSIDYFYIVGWMSKKDAKNMEDTIENDKDVMLFYSEDPDNLKDIVKPPTKLKNNPIFKPFEFFVKMYGYPGYKEIDPTPLLAITYILFFGMMFGDVGQSLVFVIGGFLVYKFTKFELARIVGIVGISGTVFGYLYGSVFGNEEIIHGILPPMENITFLLLGTVSIGGFIIILGMILNIINAFDNRRYGEMIFGHNGIAGLIFYTSLLLTVLTMVVDAIKIPVALLVTLLVISFIAIYLCEPLSNLVEGKKDWLPKDGIFYVQSIFELVEVILSYFSNTISFLRIGAFAIVHVGMMMAVKVLATGGSVKTIIVSILGNILVMVLEGLVVGIQVLRLEYYEMFSRYFTGNGKPFKSLKNNK